MLLFSDLVAIVALRFCHEALQQQVCAGQGEQNNRYAQWATGWTLSAQGTRREGVEKQSSKGGQAWEKGSKPAGFRRVHLRGKTGEPGNEQGESAGRSKGGTGQCCAGRGGAGAGGVMRCECGRGRWVVRRCRGAGVLSSELRDGWAWVQPSVT